MPRRPLWQIDMGDGTWSVCCMTCRRPLYRGAKATANRMARRHRCEPAAPRTTRRRSR